MTTAVAPRLEHSKPIAPPRHTAILVIIMLALAIRGAMFQSAPGATAAPASRLPIYASLVVAELLLLYFVRMGIRRTGTSLGDLVGGRWANSREVVADVLRGAACWAVLSLTAVALARWLPQVGHVRSISPLLPDTPAEIIAWVALSICAGFVEEVVFRGYLQRQLTAFTGSAVFGLVGQAVIFGVTHGYQGWDACARITAIGLIFGGLALWRSSLRPGIIAHAWTDIASGILRI